MIVFNNYKVSDNFYKYLGSNQEISSTTISKATESFWGITYIFSFSAQNVLPPRSSSVCKKWIAPRTIFNKSFEVFYFVAVTSLIALFKALIKSAVCPHKCDS